MLCQTGNVVQVKALRLIQNRAKPFEMLFHRSGAIVPGTHYFLLIGRAAAVFTSGHYSYNRPAVTPICMVVRGSL